MYEFDIFTGKYKGNAECGDCKHKTTKSKLVTRVWKEVKNNALATDSVSTKGELGGKE
jgi:hypothetical protein